MECLDIMPEMGSASHILSDKQIINLNNLLPPRCIGAKWNLRYSSRKNGTSLGTLIRNCSTEGENRDRFIYFLSSRDPRTASQVDPSFHNFFQVSPRVWPVLVCGSLFSRNFDFFKSIKTKSYCYSHMLWLYNRRSCFTSNQSFRTFLWFWWNFYFSLSWQKYK